MIWSIELTPTAVDMLKNIPDRRVQEKIADRINKLKQDPEKQGKPLTGEFSHYRSLRAVGQRYRIIYRLIQKKVVVAVVAVGMRKEGDKKDIYSLAQKLLRLGLLR